MESNTRRGLTSAESSAGEERRVFVPPPACFSPIGRQAEFEEERAQDFWVVRYVTRPLPAIPVEKCVVCVPAWARVLLLQNILTKFVSISVAGAQGHRAK
jgi:hypothetical protein